MAEQYGYTDNLRQGQRENVREQREPTAWDITTSL